MYGQDPQAPRSARAGQLLSESLALYVAGFKPLVLTAGAGALAANLLGLVATPGSDQANLLWSAVLLYVAIGLQGPAAIQIVSDLRGGRQADRAVILGAIQRYGARYLAVTLVVGIASALLSLTFIGLPVAVFLTVRLSLAGVAIVKEDLDIAVALRRSWMLIQDRWWRTFLLLLLILLVTAIPSNIITAPLFFVGGSLLGLVLGTAAMGLTIPLTTVFTLLVYEDYIRGAPARPLEPPDQRPGS